MDSDYQQAESERRTRNGIREGVIFAVNYSGAIPFYRVEEGDFKSGWLKPLNMRSGGDREADLYELHEQVAFMMVSGGDSGGYVVGSIPQEGYPVPEDTPDRHARHYKDGAVIRYDREEHHYEIDLPKSGKITINAPAGVEINAPKGNVTVNGDVIADGVSLKNHVHKGVTPGKGLTGKPVG